MEVGEEFVSSEDEGRTELSYALVREDEYVAPPVENSIPLLIPAPLLAVRVPTPLFLLWRRSLKSHPSFARI